MTQNQSTHIQHIIQSPNKLLTWIKSAQSDTVHKKQNGSYPLSKLVNTSFWTILNFDVIYCNYASKTENVNKFHWKNV